MKSCSRAIGMSSPTAGTGPSFTWLKRAKCLMVCWLRLSLASATLVKLLPTCTLNSHLCIIDLGLSLVLDALGVDAKWP